MTEADDACFEIVFEKGARRCRRISQEKYDRDMKNPHFLTFNAHDPRWQWPAVFEPGAPA